MLLLLIIFRCTIFKCPLLQSAWNDQDLLWLLLLFFECCSYISKTKKMSVFWKGTILSLVLSVCVCFVSFRLSFFVSCWALVVVVWDNWNNPAVLSRLPPDHPSRLLKKKKKKKSINICIVRCLRELQGQRSGNVGGREEDWPVNTHYIEEKEKKKGISASDHTCKDTGTQQCNHTVIGYSFVCT